jgi:hypothetical protein
VPKIGVFCAIIHTQRRKFEIKPSAQRNYERMDIEMNLVNLDFSFDSFFIFCFKKKNTSALRLGGFKKYPQPSKSLKITPKTH